MFAKAEVDSAKLDAAVGDEVANEWSQDGAFLEGGNIEIVATVSGTKPISYQWYYNDLPIDQATASTLRVVKARVDAPGD